MIPRVSSLQGSDDGVQEFARYEFKYFLDKQTRDSLEADISTFMKYDGYVHPEIDNAYFVRSMYFDNSIAKNYYEKIDGIRLRRKFRIRTYTKTRDEKVPLFLEQKGRYIDRTFKTRVPIDYDILQSFENNNNRFSLLEALPNVPLIEEFVFESARLHIKPSVLVDYVRRPYISHYDLNFRVTFDSQIRAAAASTFFPDSRERWVMCDAGYTILEVKFHRRIPAWFLRLIQAHNLRRLSISKFCRGVEVCGLAEDLS
jgi:hypothetical protein